MGNKLLSFSDWKKRVAKWFLITFFFLRRTVGADWRWIGGASQREAEESESASSSFASSPSAAADAERPQPQRIAPFQQRRQFHLFASADVAAQQPLLVAGTRPGLPHFGLPLACRSVVVSYRPGRFNAHAVAKVIKKFLIFFSFFANKPSLQGRVLQEDVAASVHQPVHEQQLPEAAAAAHTHVGKYFCRHGDSVGRLQGVPSNKFGYCPSGLSLLLFNSTLFFFSRQGKRWATPTQSGGNYKFSYFERLTDDVLLRVFSFLSSTQLALCSRVCRRWHVLAWEPHLWSSVYLSGENLPADRALKVSHLTTSPVYTAIDNPAIYRLVPALQLIIPANRGSLGKTGFSTILSPLRSFIDIQMGILVPECLLLLIFSTLSPWRRE